MRRWIPLTLLLVMLAACALHPAGEDASSADTATVDRLETFARLYGYVRFFHPSDEAAAADWDQIAIDGVSRVLAVRDPAAFEATLNAVFKPLAPSVQLYDASAPAPAAIATDPGRWAASASWQYLGPGFGEIDHFYKRVRLNRPVPAGTSNYGGIAQGGSIGEAAGRPFQLAGDVRMTKGTSRLWIRFDDAAGKHLLLENMQERLIRLRSWNSYDIRGTVPALTSQYSFGVICNGDCSLRVRRPSLHFGDDATVDPEHARNTAFQAVNGGDIVDWKMLSGDYGHRVEPSDNSTALVIERKQQMSEPLFAEHVDPGEVLDLELDSNLRLRLPLSVEIGPDGTLPRAEPAPPASSETPPIPSSDQTRRLAAVIILWNDLRHFFPYQDEVAIDWNTTLRHALAKTLDDRSDDEFLQTLRLMSAATQDGHVYVYANAAPDMRYPPFRAAVVEGRVVVTQSDVPDVQAGDIVTAIEARNALEALIDAERYIAGSPQKKRAWAESTFGAGTTEHLYVQMQRDGQARSVEIATRPEFPAAAHRHAIVETVAPGVSYIDLTRTVGEDIEIHIDELARAKALIVDLRGYPKQSGIQLLRHLLKQPERDRWMFAPHLIRPDGQVSGDEPLGWDLQPLAPHLNARVVVMTDASAISYGESLLGYFEGLRLGEIVGSCSAGTNGDIQRVTLPGNIAVTFTGLNVRKHDGSRMFGLGFCPATPWSPTLAGLAAGKDELLDQQIERLVH